MRNSEFQNILADTSKEIVSDIMWSEDEDHSPSVEFRVDIVSNFGYPLFVRGSYNSQAQTLTYVVIHRCFGRIYGLDLGKDHHNPSCNYVGEKHKHRWDEILRDKCAYVPEDITAAAADPVSVWLQFCQEANITHRCKMYPPPPVQMVIL